ncbi:hypothetical protein [Chimaeribacter arupi]|uniref:hypothetical protein n=1 Tax=Chimaeribacter arupi TaxID=2060066 RepID=UPI000C798BBF|nr:hypothetical protein [Chimaeribacter arupi]PLR29093.1 hypothetical protein CYR23_21595 [Chimaeribacter arupi]
MEQRDVFIEAKAICTEIGIAVLASLGDQRAFTLETLIDILQEAQEGGARLGAEREHSMVLAVKILASFAEKPH